MKKNLIIRAIISSITIGTIAMTTTMASGITAEAKTFTKGDVNMDGAVNLMDAQVGLKGALGITSVTDEQKLVGDMDGNGSLNLKDVQSILRAALGIDRISEVVEIGENTVEPTESAEPTTTVTPVEPSESPEPTTVPTTAPTATPEVSETPVVTEFVIEDGFVVDENGNVECVSASDYAKYGELQSTEHSGKVEICQECWGYNHKVFIFSHDMYGNLLDQSKRSELRNAHDDEYHMTEDGLPGDFSWGTHPTRESNHPYALDMPIYFLKK